MATELVSAVIVRNKRGYIASLRFTDRRKDIDLSSHARHLLYRMIEDYFERNL